MLRSTTINIMPEGVMVNDKPMKMSISGGQFRQEPVEGDVVTLLLRGKEGKFLVLRKEKRRWMNQTLIDLHVQMLPENGSHKMTVTLESN